MVELRRYFFFFLENAKNLGLSDDGKRRKKKGMALKKVWQHRPWPLFYKKKKKKKRKKKKNLGQR